MTILILKIAETQSQYRDTFTAFLPIRDYALELLTIYLILYPLAAIIGIMVIGYIIDPIMFIVFVKVLGRNLTFGIQEYGSYYNEKKIRKSILPILMAINLAIIFSGNQYFVELMGMPESFSALTYFTQTLPTYTILLIFTLAISLGIFSSIWASNDAGLIHCNVNKVDQGKIQIIEGKSFGSNYKTIIKGYAGISAIFSYFQFISIVNNELVNIPPYLVSFLLIILPGPLYLALASLPALMINEVTSKTRVNMLKKLARRFNFKEGCAVKID